MPGFFVARRKARTMSQKKQEEKNSAARRRASPVKPGSSLYRMMQLIAREVAEALAKRPFSSDRSPSESKASGRSRVKRRRLNAEGKDENEATG
jgi:hypothetical protein